MNDQSTKAILKIKVVNLGDHKENISFEDKDGKMVQERVHTYRDDKNKDILLTLEKQLLHC